MAKIKHPDGGYRDDKPKEEAETVVLNAESVTVTVSMEKVLEKPEKVKKPKKEKKEKPLKKQTVTKKTAKKRTW